MAEFTGEPYKGRDILGKPERGSPYLQLSLGGPEAGTWVETEDVRGETFEAARAGH